MDNKYQQTQDKKMAAGNCSSSCSKCSGQCTKQDQHGGSHQCQGGHSW